MSTEDDFDLMLPMKAIENGALKFLMNPITVETLRYLQQYVARDKLEKANKSAKKGSKADKKTCIKWTDELHAKFLDAVNELRDGSIFLSLHFKSGLPGMLIDSINRTKSSTKK